MVQRWRSVGPCRSDRNQFKEITHTVSPKQRVKVFFRSSNLNQNQFNSEVI
jgi:hypothetical protein